MTCFSVSITLLTVNGWQHISAFVIQFPSMKEILSGRFNGRIEHVSSGLATRFESQTEMLGFITNTMQMICSKQVEPDCEADYIEEADTNV